MPMWNQSQCPNATQKDCLQKAPKIQKKHTFHTHQQQPTNKISTQEDDLSRKSNQLILKKIQISYLPQSF